MKSLFGKGVLAALSAVLLLAAPLAAKAKKADWKGRGESDRVASHAYQYLSAGATKKALKYFEKAAKVDPENASAFEGLGDAWTALGKDEKAKDAYDKADALNNGKSSAGRAARAKDGVDRAEASKLSAHAYGAAAKGDYKLAVELFKKALAVDKGYWHAKDGLSDITRQGLDKSQTAPTKAGAGDKDDEKDDAKDED